MEKYTSIAINGIGTKEVSEAVMAALVNSGWVISDSVGAEDRDLLGEEFIVTVYHRKAYA